MNVFSLAIQLEHTSLIKKKDVNLNFTSFFLSTSYSGLVTRGGMGLLVA